MRGTWANMGAIPLPLPFFPRSEFVELGEGRDGVT